MVGPVALAGQRRVVAVFEQRLGPGAGGRAQEELGDDVRVRMIGRTGHVELIAPETGAWAAAVAEIERLLGR